jgi:hypothetical protein
MGCKLTDLFSIEELQALDQKQLDLLRDALVSEIRTSTEIRSLLRTRLHAVYSALPKR